MRARRPLAPFLRWLAALALGATLPAVGQSVVWSARYGTSGRADGDAFPGPGANLPVRGQRCLAVDLARNLYVVGQAWNGVSYDFLTVKYDTLGNVAWSRTLDRGFSDVAYAVAVDGAGSVYATGVSSNGANNDFLTVKYDALGNRQWVASFDAGDAAADEGYAIAVDASGNVYAAGVSYRTNWDYRVVKYSAAGVQQWTVKYGRTRNDYLYALGLDGAGNVYLAGYSSNGSDDDYATVKLDPAGNQLWAAIYAGVAAGIPTDQAYALAVDAAGNAVVAGRSWNGSNYDYRTLKYDAAGGQLWNVTYAGPAGSDEAYAVALDAAGNVHVTGSSPGVGTGFDYATVKYDAAGVEQWTRRYDGAGSMDQAYAVAVDGTGHVVVTGHSATAGTGFDFATVRYDSAGTQQWAARHAGPGTSPDEAFAVAADIDGNVLVAGQVFDGVGYDWGIVKYAPAGTLSWAVPEPPSRGFDDMPGAGAQLFGKQALAVDGGGNVYVTGRRFNGTNYNVATVKYSPAGTELWARLYDGPDHLDDQGQALAVDGSGNVYVAGQSMKANFTWDFVTLKYDAAGTQQWLVAYDGPVGSDDQALALAVDGVGNVYVTGQSWGGGNLDYATVKYDAAGAQQWAMRYAGPGGGPDQPVAVAVDGSGNVYVTGSAWVAGQNLNYATVKYDAAGAQQWVALYNNATGNQWDQPAALALDGAGNVYVTGLSYGGATGNNAVTIKYDPAGAPQWAAVYNSPAGRDDQANALALDAAANVYLAGQVWNGVSYDTLVVKYSVAGVQQWERRHDGPGGSDEQAWAVAVDTLGNVFAAGTAWNRLTHDYLTVKYDAAGNEQWAAVYDGPSGRSDQAYALALDAAGYAHVSGWSMGSDPRGDPDFLTLKYSPVPDVTAPGNPTTLSSLTHTVGAWSRLAAITMQWSGAADEPGGSGLAGYSVVFDAAPATLPDATVDVAQTADPHALVSAALPDGAGHYFHLRTCDQAHNCSSALHRGPYWIDATPPSAAGSLSSTSHTVGVPSADPTIDLAWTAAVDPVGGSGLAGYAVAFDGLATPPCDQALVAGSGATTFTSAPLAYGTWYAHVCAADVAGNWGPVAHAGPYTIAPLADLSLSQADSPDPAPVYGTVTYALQLSNAGPSATSAVTLVDTLPPGTSFVSSSPGAPDCAHAGGVVTCALAGLAAGAGQAVTITVVADPGTLGTVTNQASLSAPEGDPAPGNNASSEPTRIRFIKGDADNDLGTDLFLRHAATGQTLAWLMNGVTRLSSGALSPQPGLALEAFGVDDFSGDHRNDFVLRDTATGVVEFWLMNGLARVGPPLPLSGGATLALNWKLSATADFDHDGRPDVVWRNFTSQKIVIWTMNGTAKTGNIVPVPDQAVDANWEIVAALDYDGDGNTDFLWYNWSSGKIVIWYMNAAVQRLTGSFTTPANAGDANWKVLASGDYGVGAAGLPETNDIVWRNATSGRFVVWHMDLGGHRTSGLFTVPAEPDSDPTGWTIVGPR